ncbi:hypothetical protein [Marimonas arenosa]|uniref:Uncharacterized protein n=1 Tax=Marimonas arenosa TaxID=1795305 RepID=A0AAE4B365_9RHOB|nr:hypothetical protein [Marimonas arenosa]MDQ2088972.1 hypothetical protein [Marimonas arenosa]
MAVFPFPAHSFRITHASTASRKPSTQAGRGARHGLLAASASLLLASPAQSQNVINSNTTIRSALCVGFNCADTETYGTDVIRMKTANIRLHADDSSSSTFPNNDWRLVFNDSTAVSTGGKSYFAVEDATSGNVLLRLDAGARDNALVLDSSGELGLGTMTPITDIHVATGDSPTIRLEQDGSGTFAAQSWDIGGNEQSFFVRDNTVSSGLPFRIKPGAPSGSLYIDPDGDVAIGINGNISSSLHVRRNDGSASLLVEEANGTQLPRNLLTLKNNGRPEIAMANTSTGGEWSFGAGTNFILKQGAVDSASSAKTKLFEIKPNGDATLTGSLTTGGTTCGGGCDIVFSEDFDLPSIAEHAEAMFSLGFLPNVGPTIENAPINVTDKLGRMLNELEHAHIYIAELEARDAGKTARIELLEAEVGRISELEARLTALETNFSGE